MRIKLANQKSIHGYVEKGTANLVIDDPGTRTNTTHTVDAARKTAAPAVCNEALTLEGKVRRRLVTA